MRRFIWRSAKKAGLPPGSLEYIGESRQEPVTIKVVRYDADGFEERQVATGEECVALAERPGVTWIRVSGVHKSEPVQHLGSCFDIHPLVLEDVVNTTHRPKLEDLDRYLFVILKVLHLDEKTDELHSEQVSLIVQDGCVISFQETPENVFTPVLERIRSGRGRIRGLGADYLAVLS
jgi:magnesium transporter